MKRGSVLSKDKIDSLRALVEESTIAIVAKRRRVSTEALTRAIAGFPVLEGTRSLIDRGLESK